ncbi:MULTISPECIES: class C beta-lactamase [Providencia]|uniref:Beta-lactamase n=1 Tax=Providencia rettgeri TaxID=587 RepID=A0A1J0E2A9_PRORE|nr:MULTISPECIES: class C beta-lactamase [Providencia]APC10001.1 Beta-lactamase [Providencia rettgeri]AVL73646.1 class C beta-lactamase [Providencia rettgeri]EIU7557852.1 beta-lactamase [Providencia rettgeri]EJD6043500.1 beta-lactamase [Providencia rettgeri]EJD6499951.1 beta-lactamase [Providencia rettgeri]
MRNVFRQGRIFAALSLALTTISANALTQQNVDNIIKPLMKQQQIPGMSVAISIEGKHYFYHYGVLSKQSKAPINNNTLFEIGSLSKTFTATLAAYAQEQGKLDFSQKVSHYLPELTDSAFDHITVMNLATHTSGLPLFVPETITNSAELISYYQHWLPEKTIGEYRSYSNLGTGLLGIVTAKQLKMPFEQAMEKLMLPSLGLKHTYIHVPKHQMKNYAQGYNKKDHPARVAPQILDAESYGLKSTAKDLIRFLDINMQTVKVAKSWQEAVEDTHTGFYLTDSFVQDMMWESYPWPVSLSQLHQGNRDEMALQPQKIEAIKPAMPPETRAFYNKTGSTNGFAAYAAFIPEEQIGIVILSNKWYPISDRITAAYQLIEKINE